VRCAPERPGARPDVRPARTISRLTLWRMNCRWAWTTPGCH